MAKKLVCKNKSMRNAANMLNEYIFKTAMKNITNQQEFLRDAMRRLNMTREQFAERIGTVKRRLDNWLVPIESREYREMDGIVWKFVREILENEEK